MMNWVTPTELTGAVSTGPAVTMLAAVKLKLPVISPSKFTSELPLDWDVILRSLCPTPFGGKENVESVPLPTNRIDAPGMAANCTVWGRAIAACARNNAATTVVNKITLLDRIKTPPPRIYTP